MSENSIIEKLGITQGPWKIEKSNHSYGTETDRIGPIDCGVSYADDAWLDVSDEDELLIAATPEMLEALIEFCIAEEECNEDGHAPFSLIDRIEKATGKTWKQIKELIK